MSMMRARFGPLLAIAQRVSSGALNDQRILASS